MNHASDSQLKNNVHFVENLLVLLVAYFNYGMCQLKTGMKSADVSSTLYKVAKVLDDGQASF